MSEPTLGEILRRLDEVSRQMAEVSKQMRDDRIEAAVIFVRKDVYAAEHSGLTRRVGDLEDSNETREKESRDARRQLIFIVVAAAIPAIAGLILSVNNFLSAAGRG